MSDGNGRDESAVRLANGPTEWFLDGVRTALADLPAAEVDDILVDVRAHLADLAAELGSAFDRDAVVSRLGTPADYAAELRTAAGYPPAPQATADPQRGAARVAVLALVASTLVVTVGALYIEPVAVLFGAALVLVALPALVREGPRMPTVAALPEVRWFLAAPRSGTPGRALADFLASLQPAWWIVRALLAAVLVTVALAGSRDAFPVLVLAVLAIPLSVWLGRLSGRDRRLLWLVVPLNGLAVAAALIIGYTLALSSPVAADPQAAVSYGPSGLWQDGEREILDIHPYDASGTPLSGVYLYDQDGNPITTRGDWCLDTGQPGDPRPYPRGTPPIQPDESCVVVAPTPGVSATLYPTVPGQATLTPPPPVPSGVGEPTGTPPPPTPTG